MQSMSFLAEAPHGHVTHTRLHTHTSAPAHTPTQYTHTHMT